MRTARAIGMTSLVLSLVALLVLLLSVMQAHAQANVTFPKDRLGTPAPPADHQANPTNSFTTGAANTAVTATLGASPAQRWKLSSVMVYCSAGTAQLTVTSGGVTMWQSPATFVGTTLVTVSWAPAWTSGINTGIIITLGTCGVGNVGNMAVESDLF